MTTSGQGEVGVGGEVDQISGPSNKRQHIIERRHSSSSLFQNTFSYTTTLTSPIMSANDTYELLCLENPLLDIQGEG
jgi:hypothetical protein